MKKKLVLLFLVSLQVLCGCTNNSRYTSNIAIPPTITRSYKDFQGEIPSAMQNWETVADLSDLWFDCNYGFILYFTKISIDFHNNIWIYGHDIYNGPIGGATDYPGCKGDNLPRIIVYDQEHKQKSRLDLFPDEDAKIDSASGWSHLEGDRILLNSVFIYREPWDGANGGKNNKIYDLVILDQDGFHEILSGSWNVWAVPDYTIDNNKIYAIYQDKMTLPPKIIVVDMDTSQIVVSKDLIGCDRPRFIEVSNDDVFLLCREERFSYSLFMFSSDKLTKTMEWKEKIQFVPDLGGGNGFPVKVDPDGRIWIGFSYILEKSNGKWHLSTIEPDQNMVRTWKGQVLPETIFGMEPYKNGMVFSIEGGLFYYDIDKKTWQALRYEFPVALPMAVGTDNKIYVFTGKFVISGNL